jgi:ABC-type nitrate/sulfonate/bicarbonate transport system substrate-binding protein
MNKSILLLGPLAALTLVGCVSPEKASSEVVSSSSTAEAASSSSSVDDYQVKYLSPVGAPAVAFYDQGANTNWTSTSDVTTIPAAFGTAGYDAVVFDGVTALKLNKAHADYGFKLATWMTGGNFHLVSTKHTKTDAITKDSTFFSFGKGNLPDSVFLKLAKDAWKWDFVDNLAITYGNGVADVKTAMTGTDSYDYYFIAEPILTAVRSTGKTVNEIYNLRDEWKTYSGQSAIPQAGLFVRDSAYQAHQTVFSNFVKNVKTALDTAISTPDTVKTAMNSWNADAKTQTARFGFTGDLVYNLQKDSKNAFGLVKSDEIASNVSFVNDFMTKMGLAVSFDASLFI